MFVFFAAFSPVLIPAFFPEECFFCLFVFFLIHLSLIYESPKHKKVPN